MDTKTLVRLLGGQKQLSQTLGIGIYRINGWVLRNNLPPDYYLIIWEICLNRNIDWKPPGADKIEMKIFERHANSLIRTFCTSMQGGSAPASREAA